MSINRNIYQIYSYSSSDIKVLGKTVAVDNIEHHQWSEFRHIVRTIIGIVRVIITYNSCSQSGIQKKLVPFHRRSIISRQCCGFPLLLHLFLGEFLTGIADLLGSVLEDVSVLVRHLRASVRKLFHFPLDDCPVFQDKHLRLLRVHCHPGQHHRQNNNDLFHKTSFGCLI